MYCHPHAVKKWAKAIKPKATTTQLEQAKLMRAAKAHKRNFLTSQLTLFKDQ